MKPSSGRPRDLIHHLRSFRGLGLGLILCVNPSYQARAQAPVRERIRPTPAVVPFRVLGAAARPTQGSVDTLNLKPTHWKEGALVGAGVLGISGAILGAAACGFSDNTNEDCTMETLVGLGLGGAMGFGLGALIGGMFPKAEGDSITPASGGSAEGADWSAGKVLGTTLLATGAAFLGGDLAGAVGVVGGLGLGVLVGSKLPW